MSVSYKNQLQEYYRRRGLALPTYENERYHIGWNSTITLPCGKMFYSTGISEKEADQHAAAYALEWVENTVCVDLSDCCALIDWDTAAPTCNISVTGGHVEAFVCGPAVTADVTYVQTFHLVSEHAKYTAMAFRAGQIADSTHTGFSRFILVSTHASTSCLCDVLQQQGYQCRTFASLEQLVDKEYKK